MQLENIVMEKQKKDQIILLMAIVIFIVLLPMVLFKKNVKPGIFGLPQVPAEAVKQDSTTLKQDSAVSEASVVQQEEPLIKDPFEIPNDLIAKMRAGGLSESAQEEAGIDLPNIAIQGVVWGGDEPFAFIDGKICRKGDAPGGYQILDIDRKGVYFLYNGSRVLAKIKNKK